MRYFRLHSTACRCSRVEGFRNDGGTESACPAHEQGAQTGDDPVAWAQVGSTFATAIEDQQLVPNQRGFGNNGAESAGSCQPDNGDDQMNEKDEDVAHSRQSYQHLKVTPFRQFDNSPCTRQDNASLHSS